MVDWENWARTGWEKGERPRRHGYSGLPKRTRHHTKHRPAARGGEHIGPADAADWKYPPGGPARKGIKNLTGHIARISGKDAAKAAAGVDALFGRDGRSGENGPRLIEELQTILRVAVADRIRFRR